MPEGSGVNELIAAARAPINHAVLIRIADFRKTFPEPPWTASDIIVFWQALATRDKRARSSPKTISIFVRQARAWRSHEPIDPDRIAVPGECNKLVSDLMMPHLGDVALSGMSAAPRETPAGFADKIYKPTVDVGRRDVELLMKRSQKTDPESRPITTTLF
jgi:hypothetical protein